MDFGDRLRDLRKGRGLTQQAAAERCGYRLTQWNNWELGLFTASLKSLQRISSGLSLDSSEVGRLAVGE